MSWSRSRSLSLSLSLSHKKSPTWQNNWASKRYSIHFALAYSGSLSWLGKKVLSLYESAFICPSDETNPQCKNDLNLVNSWQGSLLGLAESFPRAAGICWIRLSISSSVQYVTQQNMFLTSKFSYLLSFNPAHWTNKTGTIRKRVQCLGKLLACLKLAQFNKGLRKNIGCFV
jgi:hypothetical protein